MLTKTERERLEKRENETPSIRARNELVIRNKLGTWLNDLDDVLFILERLPEKQLRTVFADDEIVYKIFDLAKKGPELRKFNQIYGTPEKPFVVDWVGNEKPRPANYDDVYRAGLVQDVIDDLKEKYGTEQPLLNQIQQNQQKLLNKMMERTGPREMK